jgi:DNA polymerase-3 subunit delta'
MWHGIIGHDAIVEQFRRALGNGRLASSFLFAGPAGIGKRTFAAKLAQALLCETNDEQALDPCEHCPACVQVQAGAHPDFHIVSKPDDKSDIPLALFIGDKEHRRREGLCHDIALKPSRGRRKIAVIDDADYINDEGANALLKTLEEPPPRSVLILIGTSPAKQLPTIRSRCQLVRFQPLDAQAVAELLLKEGIVQDARDAQRLACHSQGSIERACKLADAELWAFRDALYKRLAAARLDSISLARATAQFVDQAGKEAAPRRRRLRQVIGFAADFYRLLLRAQCRREGRDVPRADSAASDLGAAPDAVDKSDVARDDAEADRVIDEALRRQPLDVEKTLARLDLCLEAETAIDRNANQATLIEAWADGLV